MPLPTDIRGGFVADYLVRKKRSQARFEDETPKPTVFEYMLLSDMDSETETQVYRLACENPHAPASAFIAACAQGTVKGWADGPLDVPGMFLFEKGQLGNREWRCRRWLGVGVLDPRAHLAIRSFRRQYVACLEACLAEDGTSLAQTRRIERRRRGDDSRWFIAAGIWLAGGYALAEAFQWADGSDGPWATAVWLGVALVAVPYVCVLPVIERCVSWLLGDE